MNRLPESRKDSFGFENNRPGSVFVEADLSDESMQKRIKEYSEGLSERHEKWKSEDAGWIDPFCSDITGITVIEGELLAELKATGRVNTWDIHRKLSAQGPGVSSDFLDLACNNFAQSLGLTAQTIP